MNRIDIRESTVSKIYFFMSLNLICYVTRFWFIIQISELILTTECASIISYDALVIISPLVPDFSYSFSKAFLTSCSKQADGEIGFLCILQNGSWQHPMPVLERHLLIQPDVIVVIAFGQILPERILNLPKYGCINIHASLLPKNTVGQPRSSGRSSMAMRSAV